MGKSVAIQLARKGANVIIVARNVEKLEKAMREIRASALSPSTQSFHYISADVSIPGEASRILSEATEFNSSITPDIVWCIAGTSTPGFFLDTTPDKLRTQMDINYWSCADMAHCVLKSWLSTPNAEKKERHLIFTSSVVAFYSIVGYTPYSPAKAAIKSLSDTLYQEVLAYPNPPHIHTVFPGTIASPGLELENRGKPEITHLLEETDPIQTPDDVARNAIAGLERGEYLVTVGWLGSMMRACAWGGSRRGNWLLDTAVTWGTSVVWMFVGRDLDGKVRRWGEERKFARA
ncbi:3-dehydrosphinganine reductase [Ciborinia camelliae]|nr:3-dehydrosphinganine reductase [Ciborinia camelliae]